MTGRILSVEVEIKMVSFKMFQRRHFLCGEEEASSGLEYND